MMVGVGLSVWKSRRTVFLMEEGWGDQLLVNLFETALIVVAVIDLSDSSESNCSMVPKLSRATASGVLNTQLTVHVRESIHGATQKSGFVLPRLGDERCQQRERYGGDDGPAQP